jgi:uncharacterized protein YceK
MMKRFVIAVMVAVLSGCASSRPDATAVVQKYSAPPAEGHWSLVDDSHQFWQDVRILHSAGLQGDPDAIRTILVIGVFADGAVAEGMPDLHEVVKKHPHVAKQIIQNDNRLKKKYSHWVQ